MKQLLKWIIPVGVLLLIGVWVGLKWNDFPANEEVFIPVAKKQELKKDTVVNSSVEFDSISKDLTASDRLITEQDSINAELASIEVNATALTDEASTEQEIEVPPNQQLEIATQQKKNIQQKEIKSVSDEVARKPVVVVRDDVERNPSVVATTRKTVLTPSTSNSKRKVTPEQPIGTSNRNVTPSPIHTAKSDKGARSETGVRPNKQEVFASSSQRQEAEPQSYMSTKQIPVDYLVEVDGTYKPAASGKGVSAATFIVYNRSGKNLKKVNMEVQYLGKENQLLKKLVLPVTNISADGAVSLNVPANSEADRLVYKVLYVSSAIGDFYYEPLITYASASR